MELVERDCNFSSIHVLILLDVVQTDALDVVDRHWLRGNVQLGRSARILGADLGVLKNKLWKCVYLLPSSLARR